MGGIVTAARKEWYRWSTAQRLARGEWQDRHWYEQEGLRIVPCRRCPKFDERAGVCTVPYGTPLRKCVIASLEAHLHRTKGLQTLELGFGRRSLAKHVIELSGGSWTGLEPGVAASGPVTLGSGGYGHAADIRFAAETFDLVFGIQSLEHWEEAHALIPQPATYEACLREVWRVLKPAGSIYFDAPIHLHGHEMFVSGDLERIRQLFDARLWNDVTLEKWRFEHEPLPSYPTPSHEIAHWPSHLQRSAQQQIAKQGAPDSVWLLAITAHKRV
jgi:SAM-dependent methyltransferase